MLNIINTNFSEYGFSEYLLNELSRMNMFFIRANVRSLNPLDIKLGQQIESIDISSSLLIYLQ